MYYEPPEPSDAEQRVFDAVEERHPEWTAQQIWDEVDRLRDEAEIDAAEAFAEWLRDGER